MLGGYSVYAVIDLETTGLKNNSEIAQVAIWNLDDKLNPISYSNNYFSINNEMPIEAYRVNALSKDLLYKLSNGVYFNDMKDWFIEELKDKVLVAHNASFEKRVLGYHLGGALNNNDWICTMLRYTPALALKDRSGNGGYKQCSLTELTAFVLREINMDFDKLKDMYLNVTGCAAKAHDALFDTYCTALAFNKLG